MLAYLTQTVADSGGAAGAGLIAGGVLVYLAVVVLMIASLWKLFDKSGQKGWTAIIPILNIIVLLKVVHKELWWIILFIIPCVSIVAYVIVYFALARAFGKGAGYGLGLVVLPIIFLPMLGFGSAQYALEPDPFL